MSENGFGGIPKVWAGGAALAVISVLVGLTNVPVMGLPVIATPVIVGLTYVAIRNTVDK